MSTFERMLSVLNASAAAAVERLALNSATSIRQGLGADGMAVASGRGCRRGKRRSDRHGGLSSESLEQRRVMDISGFYTTASGGRAVLSLQGGDNLYVQQVATVPQSLIYADNSSFLNYKVIPGIESLENLYISSGRSQTDVGVLPDGYPNYPTATTAAGTTVTQFATTHQPVASIGTGKISIVQADRALTEWTYANGRITSGPGYNGETLSDPGYAIPRSIGLAGNGSYSTGMAVTWSKPSLPSSPRLENVVYFWDTNAQGNTGRLQQFDEAVIQASAVKRATLTLPSAGGANSGINPSSFDASLTIDGRAYKAVTAELTPAEIQEQNRTGRRLYPLLFSTLQDLPGQINVPTLQLQRSQASQYIYGSLARSRPVTGFLDLDNGQVALDFGLNDPGPISLDATYSVWETDAKPSSVTFFAGHDITNQVTVDLLPPGSTINVDSPIVVRPSLPDGDISLWATNVSMNARVQANDRLNVAWTPSYDGSNAGGSPSVIPNGRLSAVTLASATAQTAGGFVKSVAVTNGGSGYSYLQPPAVTISAPLPATASASITKFKDGKVTGITISNAGNRYTAAPSVFIAPPPEGVVNRKAATAIAEVSAYDGNKADTTGRITRIELTNGGFGYTTAPAVTFVPSDAQDSRVTPNAAVATASIVASIDTIFLDDAGFGYEPDKVYDLKFTYENGKVIENDPANGVVAPIVKIKADEFTRLRSDVGRFAQDGITLIDKGIDIIEPGKGIPSSAKIILPIPEAPGVNPKVVYRSAIATAAVDRVTGRISAITVLDPGKGYGSSPVVTIEPPAPTYDAQRASATAVNGTVAGVTFQKGRGLTIVADNCDLLTGVINSWTIADKGAGYSAGDVVALRKYGEPQAAYFTVTSVDSLSGAQALKLLGGGSRFEYGDVLSDFAGTAGEGFAATFTGEKEPFSATVAVAGSGYKVGDIVTVQVPSVVAAAGFEPAYLRIDEIAESATGSVKKASVVSTPIGMTSGAKYTHANGRGLSTYVNKTDNGEVTVSSDISITVPGEGYHVGDFVELIAGDLEVSPVFIKVKSVSAGAITGFDVQVPGKNVVAGSVIADRKLTAGYGFQIDGGDPADPASLASVSSRGYGYRVGDLLEMQSVSMGETPRQYLRVVAVNEAGGVTTTFPSIDAFDSSDVKKNKTNWFSVLARPAGNGYGEAPTLSIDNPFDPVGTPAKAESYIDASGRVIGIYMTDTGSVYLPDDGSTESLTVGVIATGVQQRSSVENCVFNAEIGANIYDMTIADDPATDQSRSLVLVSSTGSLSRRVGTLTEATSVVVRSFQGDVLVEGRIAAQDQSYLLQSRRRDQLVGPYALSTTSRRSGSKNGLISGGVVSITLGNDLDTPDLPDRVAYNDVTLNTDIDSLRIRAATREGRVQPLPFPYAASITESNDLAVDAVAASSFPLSFQSSGGLKFNAVLETAGDVNLRTFGELTVAAPVSTRLGILSLEAESNVKVTSSLQVTDAPQDDTRDDIVIRANAGNVQLDNGLIKAVNGVRVVQANAVSRYASTASTPLAVGTVAAPVVTTSSFTVNDTVAASDVNVKVSITHPAVGALKATLIAPNKRRYSLFSGVGGTDKNFAGTVFDTESPLSIAEGSAPFSGSYRPIDSLASLNGISLKGVWTLEVTNSGAAGSIDLFELNASTSKGNVNSGAISGTALISADRLSLVASGSVGDPAALPPASNFYLRTQVNSVNARAGGSVALSEKDALVVNSLRSPGPVTIRTDGYDQYDTDTSRWLPALRGDLIDATKVTLSAPNGSIDMSVNTADTIFFGNIGTISIPVSAQLASQYGMQAAGSVTFRSSGGATKGDVVVLDAPDAGSNARKVRSVIEIDADSNWKSVEWTYSKGVAGKVASSITGTKLNSLLPGAKIGDRVLVKQKSNNSNPGKELSHDYAGVYSVTAIDNNKLVTKLTRASDSDTESEMQSGTVVSYANPNSPGNVSYYRVRIDHSDLAQEFGAAPITVKSETISSSIGSDDPTDQTRFVVSTNDGTNGRAGSFGKMLALIQANLPASGSSSDVDALLPILQFSSSIVGAIQLDQELPLITKPFVIDGNSRYAIPGTTAVNAGIVIDGYDVLYDRNGNAVTSASEINGISYQLPEAATVASSLTNVSIGGFQQGAAIKVNSHEKSGILSIDKVNVGLDSNNNRLSNKFGVLITGTSSGVSLTNSKLASSTAAAIHIAGAAAKTNLTGNTIGLSALDNVYGIMVSSTGANSIGLAGSARNTIQYSQTGIALLNGTTTVVNNDISKNIFDGIRIVGGGNYIGLPAASKALTTDSNSIYGNSRFGINVITMPNKVADPILGKYTGATLANQKIFANYLGVSNFGTVPSVNARGNVAKDSIKVTAVPYVPNAAGTDANKNQHGVTSVPVVQKPGTPATPGKPATPSKPTPAAKTTVKFPWRRR